MGADDASQDCPSTLEIERALAGGADEGSVQAHIEGCASCRDRADEIRTNNALLERIAGIARELGAEVLEDAAQAHGATRYGATAGAHSAAVATSFYPGKNLGAYGDAGAVLTDRADLDARVRRLRSYGSEVKYEVTIDHGLHYVSAAVVEMPFYDPPHRTA